MKYKTSFKIFTFSIIIKNIFASVFQNIICTYFNRENSRRTTMNCFTLLIRSINMLLLLSPFYSHAQLLNKKQRDKLAPNFASRLLQVKDNLITVTVTVRTIDEWKKCMGDEKNIHTISFFEPAKTLVIQCTGSVVFKLLNCEAVLFADDVKQPKEELLLGFVDYSFNNVSLLQSEFPQYNGNSLSLSVKENKFDTADIDFKGRIIPSTNASTIVSGHASSMATIIAGGGNTWNYTKGAAWGSKISSASFSNLLPEPLSYYQQSNISLQNHSYGTLVEHFYGAEAAAYDASVNAIPSLVHVFSIGNSGTLTPAAGRYVGISNTANITGNFKQAKNIITVGHADSFYHVLAPSSRGPAFDGRIKPELIAFGEDGSSGAAALVSGIAGVLQHTHQQLYGSLPSAALTKAVLLNSADDVGATGIDFASGYGNVNGYKAIQTILRNRFINGTVSNNTSQVFNITVPVGIKQLKLTLSWTDAASLPNTNKALINDLDLELMNSTTLETWLPWVLSSFSDKDSLQRLPVRKKDTLNNTEQISIDNPAAGTYTITIKGSSVSTPSQTFSIAWQTDSLNTFKWYYPAKNDHLLPPDTNVLRWQSTYASTGDLEVSFNNGTSWQAVASNIDLSKGFYKYSTPDVNQTALLRMRIGAAVFESDTFSISKRPLTSVGFNCNDSVMINWQKVPGISEYRIYEMGNQYLQPVKITADTFYVFAKAFAPVLHYAIAPIQNNKELVRTYTFNYNTQGTGCFINSFLADLTLNNEARLQLFLSATVRIKRIGFQKRTADGFTNIYTTSFFNGINYLYLDAALINGSNIYRAFVELTDGRMIYSEEAVIYFQGNARAVIYPNPVSRSQHLIVLAKPEEQYTIQFFNSLGLTVLQQLLSNEPNTIKLNFLQPGIYYYRLLKKSEVVQTGKLVVF
jgi:hypothetical protein